MRRQRTSSEASEGHETNETAEKTESDRNVEEDEEMAHVTDEETENSDCSEDSEAESGYGSDNSYDDEEMSSVHADLMNQLQSALFGINGGGAVGSVNLEQLERLRMSLPISSGGATHSNRISSIIRALPGSIDPADTDPVMLYSAFTELWELIVLTGEEVEAYEFDVVVNLKPLLGHLLRVLAWDEGCQVYGSEFLLYAIRCTRACVQYSPGCARKLVEGGLVPLLINQLFSVEYIDLAEDAIQILQSLTKSGVHSKVCLQCDGIKAVLGFVDFFALTVQQNAFSAAAQMATALTDDTLDLYLPADIQGMLRRTISRAESENDPQVVKLIHQATQILHNALKSAPKHAESLFPSDFVIGTVLPHLSAILPADSASILLRLLTSANTLNLDPSTHGDLILKFLKTLLSKSISGNEACLEDALRIVIEIYCSSGVQKSLRQLIPLCGKTKVSEGSERTKPIATDAVFPSDILFEFYLMNSASLSVSMRHLTLLTFLLLDCEKQEQAASAVSLEKMSLLSKLLTELQDPLALVIGLEWFRILVHSSKPDFLLTATRQGLPAELETLKNFNVPGLSKESTGLKKWLAERLEELKVTVFSGDEDNIYEIYIRHLATDSLNSTAATATTTTASSSSSSSIESDYTFNSIGEFLALLEKGVTFTEYEWLGDPESCLVKRLLGLLDDPESTNLFPVEQFKPVCEAVFRALNRYDTIFTVNLPRPSRPHHPVDPFASLSPISRPIRVLVRSLGSPEKMFICDPMTQIGWLVKVATCASEAEIKRILRYSGIGESGSDHEDITDAMNEITDYPVVNISQEAFSQMTVTLSLPSRRSFPLKPNQSVLAALFEHTLKAAGEDAWKNLNELWAGNVIINVSKHVDSKDVHMTNAETDGSFSSSSKVNLALKLLEKIPFKCVNETLNSKLSKALDSVLLTAVNGISEHWIRAAQQFPFLFDFATRVNLMRSVCLGSLRALSNLHSRLINNINPNQGSAPSVPRRKFRIDRTHFMKCLRHVFAPVNNGDFRSFEFEYVDELGTGHGPTMEFYALASKEICRPSLGLMHVTRPGNLEADEVIEAEGEGLFPSWSGSNDHREEFRILGSLIARAWLDDRIIDIPLHPMFFSNSPIQFCDLKFIDSELFSILSDAAKMVGNGIAFHVPGTEIPLISGDDRTIDNASDLTEFQGLFMKRVNDELTFARDSFLQGFNSTFPESFESVSSFFPVADLLCLISPSRYSCDQDWTVSAIKSALVTDHGYRPDSPQITWLAELISEAPGHFDRMKLIQFLTGAAYLPIGGWKSLRPPLTIVCKTFSTSDDSAPVSESTSSLLSSPTENHDAYLPSVMTCANYLKLPRYSSKAAMKERLSYAIKEGCGSFHLS